MISARTCGETWTPSGEESSEAEVKEGPVVGAELTRIGLGGEDSPRIFAIAVLAAVAEREGRPGGVGLAAASPEASAFSEAVAQWRQEGQGVPRSSP
jgi:hypothetical protein